MVPLSTSEVSQPRLTNYLVYLVYLTSRPRSVVFFLLFITAATVATSLSHFRMNQHPSSHPLSPRPRVRLLCRRRHASLARPTATVGTRRFIRLEVSRCFSSHSQPPERPTTGCCAAAAPGLEKATSHTLWIKNRYIQ